MATPRSMTTPRSHRMGALLLLLTAAAAAAAVASHAGQQPRQAGFLTPDPAAAPPRLRRRGHHSHHRPRPWASAAAAAADGGDGPPLPPPAVIDLDALGEDIYDRSRPPPLLVTIGPQCGGKTSLLRRLNATRPGAAPPLLDVAIDDDRDVYRRVPMRAFLEGELAGPRDVRIRGRLASERCADPAPEECRLVLGYMAGLWPLHEAERGLAALSSTADVLPALIGALPRAADTFQAACSRARQEAARASKGESGGNGRGKEDGDVDAVQAMGARSYSLFVPEAIPRAVKASNQRLSAALRDHMGPVAWGNTNSKAGDFKGALRAAEAYGRRAILLRWGLELERVPLEELLVRNALRATRLGRYIPAVSVKMALERTEGLLARSGGGHPKSLLAMAGFTTDPLGRPRSTALPPEEAEPIIRPYQFAGLEGMGGVEVGSRGPPGPGVEVCRDSGGWGRGPSSSSEGGKQPSRPLLDGGAGGRRGWDDGAGDNFILATGVRVGGGGGGGGAAGAGSGALVLSPDSSSSREAAFARGVGRVSRAVGRLSLLVLRMGEWAKFKYWSKAAYDMDAEWRRDYARARNETLREREEQMRVNGTDPWLANKDRLFDFELWTILRTLSGQSNNNRF